MAAMMGMAGGFLTNPVLSALQATMGIGAPAAGAAPGATAASFGLPAVAAEATNTTDAHLNGSAAARMPPPGGWQVSRNRQAMRRRVSGRVVHHVCAACKQAQYYCGIVLVRASSG